MHRTRKHASQVGPRHDSPGGHLVYARVQGSRHVLARRERDRHLILHAGAETGGPSRQEPQVLIVTRKPKRAHKLKGLLDNLAAELSPAIKVFVGTDRSGTPRRDVPFTDHIVVGTVRRIATLFERRKLPRTKVGLLILDRVGETWDDDAIQSRIAYTRDCLLLDHQTLVACVDTKSVTKKVARAII
ncbi:unnamed protein product, partial [Scytosiphon promiscuus]